MVMCRKVESITPLNQSVQSTQLFKSSTIGLEGKAFESREDMPLLCSGKPRGG